MKTLTGFTPFALFTNSPLLYLLNMKIILDILTIITFTVGVVNIIEWTIKLPGKIMTWYYDKHYKPK